MFFAKRLGCIPAFAILALFSAGQQAGAAGLDGATVTYAGYCCTAPIPADLVSNTPSATVGPGIEFPLGSVHAIGTLNVIPFSLDVSSNMLDGTFFSSGTLINGGFNGGVLTFSGAPPIIGITVDPTSQFIPTGLSFTGTSISINGAGKPFIAGTHEIFDVMTGTGPAPVPVPEPPVWPLIALATAALVIARRHAGISQYGAR
jgi:hypothetical protein